MTHSHKKPSPFMESVQHAIQTRHYSIRTETAYVGWIKRFILFNDKRHPKTLTEEDVVLFLNYLASDLKVALISVRCKNN